AETPIHSPEDVVIDSAGNLYIADSLNNLIRKVDAGTGALHTVAGTGIPTYNGDGPGTASALNTPAGLALSSAGHLYMSDQANHMIRKLDLNTGMITTIAGNRDGGYSGDGGPATAARLQSPVHIAVDKAGNLYVADTLNHRVRKVSPGGIITTVAG